MLKVNIQTFAIKINDGKWFDIYFKFLQTDGCTMGGPPFCYIFIYIWAKRNFKLSKHPKFYKLLVNDIVKGALSGLRQLLKTGSLFKMKIFKKLSWTFRSEDI